MAFCPIVQSGGNYDLRPQAESNDNELKYDIIIATSGFKYRDYNTSMSRTLFIDPTNE